MPSSKSHRAVKYARKYKLVFSLLNEDIGKGGYTSWAAESALHSSINPLLRSLEPLHSFDVETQIQYYSPLSIERIQTEEGSVISEDSLKAFVNGAEWNLASAVSQDPVLHFLVYVPAADKAPLLVQREDGTTYTLQSFLIPQWGSIAILSPPASASSSAASASDLAISFSAFHHDLRSLLGVPSLSKTVKAASPAIKTEWEVNALMRQRITQNVADARMRLGAIARQVKQIQNMRIPEAVQRDFGAALAALEKVQNRDLRVAMNQSSIALDAATRAAFNHEMLAMLYFPDEHKWAVYTPLFGPIAVPLFVALFREIKQWRRKRRSATAMKRKTE